MIRVEIRGGIQTITEICETCKCHIKKPSDLTVKDSTGKEVTNTDPRPKCYCEHCSH